MKAKIIIGVVLVAAYFLFLIPRITTLEPSPESTPQQDPAFATPAKTVTVPAPSSIPVPESKLFNFGGEWRGKLQPLHGAHLDPRDWNLELRFFIRGDDAQVFIRRGSQWQEVKPGKFRFSQLKSNAVIYSTDSGDGWVESWVFSLSKRDEESVFVYGNRIINNYKQAPSQDGSRITYAASSVFQRSYDRFSKPKPSALTLTEDDITEQFKEALERGKRLSGVSNRGGFIFHEHKILYNNPDSIGVGVDYHYDGLDEDKVWVGGITLSEGKSKGNWSYRPAKLKRGNNIATIQIGMNSESPDEYCSDAIRIQVYEGGKGSFFEKDLAFEKCWKKQP